MLLTIVTSMVLRQPFCPFCRFPVTDGYIDTFIVHSVQFFHSLRQIRFCHTDDQFQSSLTVNFHIDALQIGKTDEEIVHRVIAAVAIFKMDSSRPDLNASSPDFA